MSEVFLCAFIFMRFISATAVPPGNARSKHRDGIESTLTSPPRHNVVIIACYSVAAILWLLLLVAKNLCNYYYFSPSHGKADLLPSLSLSLSLFHSIASHLPNSPNECSRVEFLFFFILYFFCNASTRFNFSIFLLLL